MIRSNGVYSASTVLMLSGLLQACAVDRPSSTNDARITGDVNKAIAQHSDLGAPNQIYVDTHNGVVYLSGLVDNGLVINNATAVAGQVPGVSRVVTNISIEN